ncbi:R3H and coiled-coil domain-containing protein 1-like [Elysia marginata]|uniref:R3H and coiled-coil domain-containing protein 1-like n=1 Tax=Elysia marginata TaxID=1093978 RepID=A0AAV4HZR8_9GAST|nr:R3H and coiled-coil domain-containing protein 1-like [Elysia marginata]
MFHLKDAYGAVNWSYKFISIISDVATDKWCVISQVRVIIIIKNEEDKKASEAQVLKSTLANFINQFLTSHQEEFTENILTDVGHFYKQSNDYRVLLFPPLCNFNRLLIHKTVEAHFSELSTFSIGRGRSRRTVVVFRTTLERAGTNIQLMSEQNSHLGRSHGRGRGKNMTPNERVAQWVNQREMRRMNKERWSNKSQVNTESEEQVSVESEEKCDNSMEDSHETQGTDELNEREKSKLKQTPQAQLYIPPSLRKKKGQKMSSNDDNDQSLTFSNQRKVKDTSENVADEAAFKQLPLNRPKGRGRGRKPEVEVYVPRALRTTQKHYKEVISPSQVSENFKSNQDDHTEANNSNSSQVCNGSEASFSADHHSNEDIKDHISRDSNNSFCSAESSSEGLTDMPRDPQVLEGSGDIKNFDKPSGLDVPHASSGCNYTFEFYDPAIVAFMPPAPVAKETDKDHSCKPTIPIENSYHSVSDQSYSEKGEISIACLDESKPVNTSFNADISSPLLKDSVTVASAATYSPVLQEELKHTDSKSSLIPQDAIVEAAEIKAPELLSAPAPQNTPSMEVEPCQNKTNPATVEEESEEDSWDTMFDDNGDCLDESLMDELTKTVGKVEITKPTINYLKYEPKEPDMDMQALGHVVEIYDFSPELATHDIISAFRDFA